VRSPWTSIIFSGKRQHVSPEQARGGLARFLLIVLLPLVLGPLVTVALLLYRQSQSDLTRSATAQLNSLVSSKRDLIDQWTAARAADMANLADSAEVVDGARAFAGTPPAQPVDLKARFEYFLGNPLNRGYDALLLVRISDDVVVVATDEYKYLLGQKAFAAKPYYRTAHGGAVTALAPFDSAIDPQRADILAAAPVVEPGKGTIAVVIGVIDPRVLSQLIAPVPGLSLNSHAYLIGSDGYQLGVPMANQGTPPASTAIRKALVDHLSGTETYADPTGAQVIGTYGWLAHQDVALIVEQSVQDAYAPLSAATTIFIDSIAVAAVVSALGVLLFTRSLTRPIQTLTEGAQRMASGDLATTVPVDRTDEIGLLAQSFNLMATQLRELYQDLEGQVAQRTRQLSAAAEIGRAASSILDVDQLLPQALELIRDRFGYYHASIFLLDERGEYAVLRESTGEVGARLKARGHKLAVGLGSIIGWVTLNKQPRVAVDVGEDAEHLQNELLPATRSEAAVPIKIGDRVLGALDVQSREPNAFAPADLNTLQIVADQLATALENSRLFTRQQRVANLEHVLASLTTKIYQSPNVDTILGGAATELGHALKASRVVVRLAASEPEAPAAPPDEDAGTNGNGHGPHA
jgi:HAMP domain-containing protein